MARTLEPREGQDRLAGVLNGCARPARNGVLGRRRQPRPPAPVPAPAPAPAPAAGNAGGDAVAGRRRGRGARRYRYDDDCDETAPTATTAAPPKALPADSLARRRAGDEPHLSLPPAYVAAAQATHPPPCQLLPCARCSGRRHAAAPKDSKRPKAAWTVKAPARKPPRLWQLRCAECPLIRPMRGRASLPSPPLTLTLTLIHPRLHPRLKRSTPPDTGTVIIVTTHHPPPASPRPRPQPRPRHARPGADDIHGRHGRHGPTQSRHVDPLHAGPPRPTAPAVHDARWGAASSRRPTQQPPGRRQAAACCKLRAHHTVAPPPSGRDSFALPPSRSALPASHPSASLSCLIYPQSEPALPAASATAGPLTHATPTLSASSAAGLRPLVLKRLRQSPPAKRLVRLLVYCTTPVAFALTDHPQSRSRCCLVTRKEK